jgi:hypothetical protein
MSFGSPLKKTSLASPAENVAETHSERYQPVGIVIRYASATLVYVPGPAVGSGRREPDGLALAVGIDVLAAAIVSVGVALVASDGEGCGDAVTQLVPKARTARAVATRGTS